MKKNLLLMALGCAAFAPAALSAQDGAEAIVYESVTVSEVDVKCKTNYSSTWRDNWFLQLGAGIQSPFVEYEMPAGVDKKHHITAAYNLGFGRWMSPYLGWRLSGYYGNLRWDNGETSTMKSANLNFDLMWDMFNSLGGVNAKRVFSVVPFVGLGGTFNWDYDAPASNIIHHSGKGVKNNQWTLPVSAGIQLRFRLCKYADFFLEGRALFYGDNFNNCAFGDPVDVNLQAIGGFNINFGGRDWDSYNPCDYLGYINNLNNQVNSLRGDLAATTAALAAAEAQLPCPEVVPQQVTNVSNVIIDTPLLSSVRFKINSAVISPEEEVNVYNIAQWMKDNPDQNVVIEAYADKDTGTAAYNMELSERRAQAVYDQLVNKYGISASRLAKQANGSDSQVYPDNNDWNRIVIFTLPQ